VKRPRRVALVAKDHPVARTLAQKIGRELTRRGYSVEYDRETARALGARRGFALQRAPADAELVVSLGGDGTLLAAARAASQGSQILGVNTGTLGFLTGVSRAKALRLLDAALEGRLEADVRHFLEVRVGRGRAMRTSYVLNDAVLTRGALSRIARFTLRLDGKPFSSMRADGVILASPTGSTAYNLSAGGPIVFPEVRAYVITPICPHALTQRPVVLPADRVVEVTAEAGSPEGIYLTLDGQEGLALESGAAVAVTGSARTVTLLRPPGQDYFATLSEKLNWGA
jgi:NAD+ kinase